MKKNEGKLKVVLASMPPFVVGSDSRYSGFEVELWEMIAKEIGADFEYEKHDFQELIPLVAARKADLAFASITINEKREEVVDFSHPTFDSGLRILLSKNRKNVNLVSTIKSFFVSGKKQLFKPFLFLLGIIFIFGNVLWLAEKGGVISGSYFPGIFQSIWLSLCIMIGTAGNFFVYGVTSWAGRLVVTMEKITSLAILGILIGELTAFLTTRKIKFNISGPDDLRDRKVATVKGTTSEAVLRDLGAVVISTLTIEEAYNKLKNNQVEAVVFDSPILIHYAMQEGSSWSYVVGDVFERQNYGFVMHKSSPLRKVINLAILSLKESGYYEALYQKWFGKRK